MFWQCLTFIPTKKTGITEYSLDSFVNVIALKSDENFNKIQSHESGFIYFHYS